MAENSFAQSQLADQLGSRDPFQRAQAMYQQQQQAGDAQQDSFSQPQPDANQAPVSALMQQPDQFQTGGQMNSFNQLLKQYGVAATGLQYNDLGKLQLQSRLSSKFGPGYQQMPDAMKIMKAFDQYRSQIGPADQDVSKQQGASRTLAAIMGGQS